MSIDTSNQVSVKSKVQALGPTGRPFPDCWGHRGASARYPENTLASFEAAIRDGAEGIESDVHVSKDGVVLMFHDPDLARTTNSTGYIKERNWFGEDGMRHVRTTKEPIQPIPLFTETVGFLMRPENHHVRFNIDVKVQNDPEKLFKLLSGVVTSQPSWETVLAPRILLGLWHPKFIEPAKRLLPFCQRSFIGFSIYVARKYFWNHCDAFSVSFMTLASWEGQKFREDCLKAGKYLLVWTVNDPAYMMEAVRWGVGGIITDVTNTWLDLRTGLQKDYDNVGAQYGRLFLWTTPRLYWPFRFLKTTLIYKAHESIAGPFDGCVTGNGVVEIKDTSTTETQRALPQPVS
ncbi:hypothetical protein D9756_000159 [Leucocoprinus leucothites]|uniref:GP-PDE domain-containing protein n=1 Tax=Leucocoprinus leucothites TaxID=201217 RepID=A0A8H5LNG9_9AGAR|nr:hypothetical protein D9756_000159 [Leucoagaricus leucothites]